MTRGRCSLRPVIFAFLVPGMEFRRVNVKVIWYTVSPVFMSLGTRVSLIGPFLHPRPFLDLHLFLKDTT